ncbi:MAG: sulfur oxidation c-type cytochrome SoxA [Burkholderiaceae bacterium]|nr:sulfur oxidation c-type cytochrome SoxA [Burkholderiaceae bacterium]MDO9090210.1 sulfur oxidation c-type cytochrome SoxA [Burkholderiaceae bacterium]
MSAATRAIQADDSANPAMLWVKEGEALWRTQDSRSGKACIGCHAEASSSMRGVAARYPAFDAMLGRSLNLGQRIEWCRQKHQGSPPLPGESLTSLEAYIALQSRGMPIAPPSDARLASLRARGQALFSLRMGQLDLSCAQCHDANAGRSLGGSLIPQAHPTGYPLYRLEWQGMGSLQRRLRACMSGVRAQPYDFNAEELLALEAYLMQRAQGMAMDAPAVRP